MKTIKYFALIAVAMLCASCSQRLVDFTIISFKNIQLAYDRASAREVKGKHNRFLGMGASIKEAMDRALKSAGPEYDLLIDGVVRVNSYYLVAGYSVTGSALSSKTMRAELGARASKNGAARTTFSCPRWPKKSWYCVTNFIILMPVWQSLYGCRGATHPGSLLAFGGRVNFVKSAISHLYLVVFGAIFIDNSASDFKLSS